jgi:hypothetical protein
LHIQNQSIQIFTSRNQWSNRLALELLCRILLHEERNHNWLCLNFAAVASIVCSIETFKFDDHCDESEKRFVDTKFCFLALIFADLMSVIQSLFSQTNHLLCLWHINNNVLTNCKKSFSTKKEWNVFFLEWKTMIYASSKKEFEETWKKFCTKYVSHENCVEYLRFIYIAKFRRHFVKCFINKILHFEIITISRDEDSHAILKRQLKSSSEDLKTMINAINLLLMNEYQNYRLKLKDEKTRYSLNLRQKIYRRLCAHITHYALRKISHQYDLLTNRSTIFQACINIFIIITELSCSYRIQDRLYQEEIIQLRDVHSHWR